MGNYHINILAKRLFVIILLGTIQTACNDDILVEEPLDFLNSDVVLVNREGFEAAITGLHAQVRNIYFYEDGTKKYTLQLGTDVGLVGEVGLQDFKDYQTWLNPTQWFVQHYWQQMYLHLIPRANIIIENADDPENIEWATEEEKNAIIAEARFFRAYAYNFLANLYGGVPIVDEIFTEPKADFVRNTREDVYSFAAEDLEYASEWLPEEVEIDGRVEKGAADHLLAEVYISKGEYEQAIAAATRVIESGRYQLMTERFGSESSQPGDIFSDLFATGNQNRSEGNLEAIWNVQFEPRSTPGGTAQSNRFYGVSWLRAWGPKWYNIKDPNGANGMILTEDSLGRGVAWVRPTWYFTDYIWQNSDGDIRNSPYNIRRDFYYNNPESVYFGQKVDTSTVQVDTMEQYYPMIRKIEGNAEEEEGATYGRSFDDVYIMRLAETYLLRAEAYFLNDQPDEAAVDLNVVRERANAPLITAADVSMDFILDERARELIVEENRRLTLSRTGTLVDRVKRFNPHSSATIQEYHVLYPIPQTTIDANIETELKQNPGYVE